MGPRVSSLYHCADACPKKKGKNIYISFLGVGSFCVFAHAARFRMVGFGNTLCIYYVVATTLP